MRQMALSLQYKAALYVLDTSEYGSSLTLSQLAELAQGNEDQMRRLQILLSKTTHPDISSLDNDVKTLRNLGL